MILSTQEAINYKLKKTKMISIRKIGIKFLIRIKIRLSPIISILLTVSLRPRLPKITNVIKIVKAIQLRESMILRYLRRTIILMSVSKIKKISGSFNGLYINDKKENKRKIRIDTLHLIFYHLQGLD